MSQAALNRFRFAFSSTILVFGLTTLGAESIKWLALSTAVYTVPLVCQFFPWTWMRVCGTWWGVFLLLQTLMSPLVPGIRYQTLPPNFSRTINVVGGYLGISGIQHITTDSMGYRSNGRVDYASSEPFRIFAIGASTTEEIDLDDSKTWTHLLEQRLSDQMGQQVEVINTGLSGLRAVNNVATLEKILPLNPDLAIFLVGVNDWNHQIRLGTEGFWQREVASRTESFWFGNTLLGKFLRSYKLSTRNTGSVADTMAVEVSGEYYELMRDSLNRPDVRRFRPQAATHEYSENIRRIRNICESAELRCMFMTQPTAYSPNVEDELRANFWMTPPNKDYTLDLDSMMRIANLYNNFLLEFAKGEQLPYCDLAARMPPSVYYFTDDCHFNEHGAERVSRIIAACVLDQF